MVCGFEELDGRLAERWRFLEEFGGANEDAESFVFLDRENSRVIVPWFRTLRTKTSTNHTQEHRHHQEPLYSKYNMIL
jgi:hypothetical protein